MTQVFLEAMTMLFWEQEKLWQQRAGGLCLGFPAAERQFLHRPIHGQKYTCCIVGLSRRMALKAQWSYVSSTLQRVCFHYLQRDSLSTVFMQLPPSAASVWLEPAQKSSWRSHSRRISTVWGESPREAARMIRDLGNKTRKAVVL